MNWPRPTFFCQNFRKHQWRPFDIQTGRHVGPYWAKPQVRWGSASKDRWDIDLSPEYNWCCLRCGQWALLADERLTAIALSENGRTTNGGKLSVARPTVLALEE